MLLRMLERILRRREPAMQDAAALRQQADQDDAAGRLVDAVTGYRTALELDPANAIAWNNLGWTLQRQDRLDDALDAYQQALALEPGLLIARNNVGTIHRLRGDPDSARAEYEEAMRASPRDALTHLNLGTVMLKQGEAETALDHFRKAVALAPQMEDAQRALLLALNFLPGVESAEAFAYYRAWGARCAARVRRLPLRRATDPERRLRIGYVSPDFRAHAMSAFIEPALANHDTQSVEIFCYDNSPVHDAVSTRLRSFPTTWREIRNLDDDAAAALIQNDGIDVLVDLAGHTTGDRLELFARRPAPLQVSLLGYLNTTGLDAIDYRICDVWSDPPGIADRFHVEQLWRLPGSLWCFRPPDDAPAIAPLPALASGQVTFGSFNNFAKLNHAVTDAWAELLARCPGSRLIVAGVPEGGARARFVARFSSRGIDASRIDIFDRLPLQAFREMHQRVDIALDPFPYAGGATTCESLWMGVPVVTMAGGFGFARSGASLLQCIDLGTHITEDADEYVACARRLAADLPALQVLRASLRERIRHSPLVDGRHFAARLEAAYRGMWRRRCGPLLDIRRGLPQDPSKQVR